MDQDQDTNTIFTLNDYGIPAFFFMLAVVLHRAGAPVLLEAASLTSVLMAMEFIQRSKKQKLEAKTVVLQSLLGVAIFGMFSYIALFKDSFILFSLTSGSCLGHYIKAKKAAKSRSRVSHKK